MEDDVFVEINNLEFKRQERTLYSGIHLTIPRGKITAILGPSGCGKTTLLRLIVASLKPHNGRILVNGQNLFALTRKDLYAARRKIGFLFQSSALFTNFSVFDNVAFPLREHTNLSDAMIKDLVLLKLNAVGLRGAHHLMPSALSGGMARRVALARAIVFDPDLVLYDEPFVGLDPIAKGVIVKLIREINEVLGLTSVIVSHDVDEVVRMADHIYVMADGQIIGTGTPQEIMQEKKPMLFQFMHGEPDGVVPFHYPALELVKDFL